VIVPATEPARGGGSAAADKSTFWHVLWYRFIPFWAVEDVVWKAWTGVVRTGRSGGWRFAAVGLVAGAVLVAGVRGVVSSGADAGGWFPRLAAAVVGVAALAGATVLMVRWYLRHRAAQDDPFPVLSAVVLSAVAAGLAVVAFAGVATLVWRAGWASPPHGRMAPGYPQVERSYLWALVDSVPVLDLPRRFGWVDPLPLTGTAADVVRLVYRFVLLVPLIRVVQAGYSAARSRWQRAYERRTSTLNLVNRDLAEEPGWAGTPAISSAVPEWQPPAARQARRRAWDGIDLTGTGQLLVAALTVLAVVGSGYLPRLPDLARTWPGAGPAVTAAGWLAAALPWLLAAWLVHRWCRTIPRRGEDLIGLPLYSVTAITIAWIVQIVCAAAAVLNLLVRAGLATVTPAGSGTRELLEVLAWQVTDVLPGPNIVEGLHWRRPGALHGPVAELVEIAVLLSVVALLAFPIGRAVQVWSERASRWRDPDRPAPGRARDVAVQAAAGDLSAADRAVRDLAALVSRERLLQYWVVTHMAFPWAPEDGRRHLSDRLLSARERRLHAAVTGAERALLHVQNARLRLTAARAEDVTVAAFDAAAAAVRRHYLHLGAHDIDAHDPGPQHRGGATKDGQAERIAERAAHAVEGFADLLTPTARQEGVSWRDLPVTLLGPRLADVAVADLLAYATSAPFRQRWDLTARLPVVLGAVADRPAAQVAAFGVGLLAIEQDEQAGGTRLRGGARKTDPAATGHLLELVRRQGDARVVDTVAALLALPPTGRPPLADRCASLLVRPYYAMPTADLTRLCVQLHDAGCHEFARRKLDAGLLTNHDIAEALETLHETGRDDLRPWILSLASTWGSANYPEGRLPDDERGAYLVRLARQLADNNSPPEDFLAILGHDVPRPGHLRERLTKQLQRSSLDKDRWTPLL
jgi:hypothetical protein